MGHSILDDDTRHAAMQAAEARSDDLNDLFVRHYETLVAIAGGIFAREPRGNSLSPTVLAHEVYIAFLDQPKVSANGTLFFRACFARQCRHILVDHARRRQALQRGGDKPHETLDTQVDLGISGAIGLLAIHDALEQLGKLDPRMLRVADMRLFAGMSNDECATALQVSTRTVSKLWSFAQGYLQRELR